MERRAAPRFRLGLPVRLEHAEGVTRDISASGVFLTVGEPLVNGSVVKFVLELEHIEPGGRWPIVCQGQVVRVEPVDNLTGLAVQFESYGFNGLSPSDGMPEWDETAPTSV